MNNKLLGQINTVLVSRLNFCPPSTVNGLEHILAIQFILVMQFFNSNVEKIYHVQSLPPLPEKAKLTV